MLIIPFGDIAKDDLNLVGGKNIALGLMYQNLSGLGVKVPSGFAITTEGFRLHLEHNGLTSQIESLLAEINFEDVDSLNHHAKQIRSLIRSRDLPKDLYYAIVAEAEKYFASNPNVSFAVRSSATAEDQPDASFAGQQETYLNISTVEDLLTAVKNCFASLYTDRAISYRKKRNITDSIALSVGVQQMVRSDLACSGVAFSIDPESGFKNSIVINSAYGLGELVVQGAVDPDEYVFFKESLNRNFRSLLRRHLGAKEVKMVYDVGGEKKTKIVPVDPVDRNKFTLSESEATELAKAVVSIENYFSKLHSKPTPMDIEWAKDGLDGELYIVQARPETVHANRNWSLLESYELKNRSQILISGRAVGSKIARGKVRVITDIKELQSVQQGEILVATQTSPFWEPVLKRVSGIITDHGGRTCHAAILSRELGIPAVIGTGLATKSLKTGDEVTVSCAEGETGKVYKGLLDFGVRRIDTSTLPDPRTKLMINLANPEEAFRLSQLPCDGVGLARQEFIITNSVKVHPLALIYPERVTNPIERAKIDELTASYNNKSEYFVSSLSSGVASIAAAFYPRPVIIRFSDFKTNEYSQLLGGEVFEPDEENPMIGFRGASRYYHPDFVKAFEVECLAIARCYSEMGLTNISVMIPFCRTVEEAKKVIQIMSRYGLKRENGLKIYLMCEIPSNAILAREFARYCDGFSIGSNDLTQLTLGIDRDSELVEELFDERNLAVKTLIKMAIEGAHSMGKHIGICGQAPSDYPEFTRFLVESEIDSISLNPDSFLKMIEVVYHTEEDVQKTLASVAPNVELA